MEAKTLTTLNRPRLKMTKMTLLPCSQSKEDHYGAGLIGLTKPHFGTILPLDGCEDGCLDKPQIRFQLRYYAGTPNIIIL